MTNEIPIATIDTLARSIYKETSRYGFAQVDIIRLINELMELCTNGEVSVQIDTDDTPPKMPHAQQSPEMPLQGKRIIIREYNGADDENLLKKWLPDRYGRYFALSCATAQSMSLDALTSSGSNHLGIITLKDGRPIGAMAYLDHSLEQKRAELRKLIGDVDSRGQGLAEEATRLWIDYGIGSLALRKIYVSTLQTQISNIRLNESVGFKVEGVLRNEVLIDGRRHDVLRMGLCCE